MSNFKIIFTYLITSIAFISCNNNSENKKNDAKAKNTTINSVWDNEFDYSGAKFIRQLDLTQIVLNTPSPFSIKIFKDSDYIICAGTITLAGTNTSGFMTSVSLSLFDTSDIDKISTDLTCKKIATDSNNENSGKGKSYEFSNSLLKLCDNGNCAEYN